MAQAQAATQTQVSPFKPSQGLKTFAVGSTAVGLLILLLGLIQNPERTWASWLTAFVTVSGISVGGFFFVAIQHIAKAGWSASIRRLAEGFSAFFPVLLIGSLLTLAGVGHLFPWANPEYIEAHALVKAKLGYLNVPFMAVRLIIFAGLMWFFAKKIVGNSLAQDISGDEALTHKNLTLSVIWAPLFALSFSFFCVDLVMSLMPTWYSTIFAIYIFAGSFQAALALLILIMIYMKNRGYITGYYGADHIHDVAKFLKGFSVFWAYIAFSQFMLIWYANIPEETEFFLIRAQGGWMTVSLALLVFKFIIPFLALLPRGWKRNESHVAAVSLIVIASQYLDIFWLVAPNFNEHQLVFGFYELGGILFMVGVFTLALLRFYQSHSLVAIKDPRMHESLAHHVTY
jgi:hypothetical protein